MVEKEVHPGQLAPIVTIAPNVNHGLVQDPQTNVPLQLVIHIINTQIEATSYAQYYPLTNILNFDLSGSDQFYVTVWAHKSYTGGKLTIGGLNLKTVKEDADHQHDVFKPD